LKSSRPPVSATWLFERLTRCDHREALAGDLLEEYGRRRSAAWYWRQVLAAIASDFFTEFRSCWVSIVFAFLVCGSIPWKQLFLNPTFQSFLFSGIQMRWPVSFLAGVAISSAFQGAILLAALTLYTLIARSFHLPSFWMALCCALLTLALGNAAVTISQVLPWPREFFYFVIWRLPLFFSLVLSIWLASAHARQSRVLRLAT
jgi:hypothetical protein